MGYYLRPQWEAIWYLHKGTPPVPKRAEGDIWQVQREQAPDHSCQKPEKLLRRLMLYSGTEGEVLDPFAGSGTTARAAKDLGRKCTMIEIEERYCEIAANRCRQEVLPL